VRESVGDDEPAQVGYVSVVDYAAVGASYADADVDDESRSIHGGLLLEVVRQVVR
jgi:hypothetical protein